MCSIHYAGEIAQSIKKIKIVQPKFYLMH